MLGYAVLDLERGFQVEVGCEKGGWVEGWSVKTRSEGNLWARLQGPDGLERSERRGSEAKALAWDEPRDEAKGFRVSFGRSEGTGDELSVAGWTFGASLVNVSCNGCSTDCSPRGDEEVSLLREVTMTQFNLLTTHWVAKAACEEPD